MPNNDKLSHNEEDDVFVAWGLGWAFWIQWVLANAIGWSLGPLAQQALIEASGTSRSQAAMGLALGLTLGLAQWFVFLPQPYKTGLWWVLVNVAGWGIGWPLGWSLGWANFSPFGFGAVYAMIGGLAGTAAGVGQWLLLKEQIRRAGWWIVASALGWSLALALTFSLARNLGWTLSGGLAGALSGGPLLWLLRQPIDESLRAWIRPER